MESPEFWIAPLAALLSVGFALAYRPSQQHI
jgi:hypothetical protein